MLKNASLYEKKELNKKKGSTKKIDIMSDNFCQSAERMNVQFTEAFTCES
jgi:hypothetical protein